MGPSIFCWILPSQLSAASGLLKFGNWFNVLIVVVEWSGIEHLSMVGFDLKIPFFGEHFWDLFYLGFAGFLCLMGGIGHTQKHS